MSAIFKNITVKSVRVLLVTATLFATWATQAAIVTDLSSSPLTSAAPPEVLPNVMYIIDNSGSMASDYMPDYVKYNNKCKSSNGTFSSSCGYADPPYMASDFNNIYYNPETRYIVPVKADGNPYEWTAGKSAVTSANTAGWTSVPVDAYRIQSTSNTSLVPDAGLSVGYPDKVWCNTAWVTVADLTNPAVCRKNSQYIYPNATFNQAFTLRGHPYYYTVSAGEHCVDKNMKNCIISTVPTVTHPVPAKLRWCKDSSRIDCQAKFTDGAYLYAKWTGVTNGTSGVGTIKILAQSPANSPAAASSAMSITNITIDSKTIIPASPSPALTITDTTSGSQRTTLAANIAAAINNFAPSNGDPDFTATSSGDLVTITAPIGTFAGAGFIDVTTTNSVTAAIAGVAASGNITITRAGKAGVTGTGNSSNSSATQCRTSSPGSTSAPTDKNSVNCPTTITISTISIGSPGSSNAINSAITYNPTSADSTANQLALATLIKNKINQDITSPQDYTASCAADSAGNCTTRIVTITAVNTGTATHGSVDVNPASGSNLTFSKSAIGGGVNGIPAKTYTIPTTTVAISGGTPVLNTFNRVDIEPGTVSNPTVFPKAATRTDCTGATTCTYAEEMTNFANWYSYYRTRMQMMKSSTSLAFKSIDAKFRVGYITIANQTTNGNYLPIAKYDSTQKGNWYTRLFATNPQTTTPLRSALSIVGRIYAGQGGAVVNNSSDPMQYSCQQNYAILTTDGYWNTDSSASVKDLNGDPVNNRDSAADATRPMYEGPLASSESLADVAKYYYDTDLRNGSNCIGGLRPNGTTGDVCENNVFVTATDNNIRQHMTTFTLGLGVDGTLSYTSDYKVATDGDFYELKQGTRDWPVPLADKQVAVDDLWHAAVNGQGTYFSAKNPTQLSTSLSEALQSIKSKVGAGAAAATSSLSPESTDNFSYVASYTTQKWIGNLERRTIDIDTGDTSENADWCVEDIVGDSCTSPSSIVSETSGSSTNYYCSTPGATSSTCSAPAFLDGTNCKLEVARTCSGTLKNKVGTGADSRTIYMNVNGSLAAFNEANLTLSGNNANFENTSLAKNLSHYASLTATQQTAVNKTTLVNFLRGNTGYEDRASNVSGAVDNRLYRMREATLGDIVNTTPVFLGVPKAKFSDPGYGPSTTSGTFTNVQSTRAGTVYIGSNDGMVHAINASTGDEIWAYVPSMVMSNMWKLADKNYGIGSQPHSFYVNGDISINDVCTANCASPSAVWRTVLVGGLAAGGKGYFALDVTSPTSPSLLWEFSPADDDDLGFSYGNPIMTKKSDGTWVVLMTSGYNNVTGTNKGKGVLYVADVNAKSAAPGKVNIIGKYITDAGDDGDTVNDPAAQGPSGLAKISTYVADAQVSNETLYVYGGDLFGNVWRFDINTAKSSTNPAKVAVLKDSSNKPQPITTPPQLASISGNRVVYVGTGRYLGLNDLTDTQQQTIYAIRDDAPSTTLDNPRASAGVKFQELVDGTGADLGTRTIKQPMQSINLAVDKAWYIDLPAGERQNIPAKLLRGKLVVATTVPNGSTCSPDGVGFTNYLDYRTGGSVAGAIVSNKTNAPPVGINILYIKGKPVVSVVTSDNPTPTKLKNQPFDGVQSSSEFGNHRAIWRELIEEQ